ncbi:ATP synthase F1 subunit epsilon [Acetobacterium woodii]|uniref:ATP synthase epsilon chain, sodium ion specific n=1 Tax=Acetobacterium woodii (strain ATCC 29683 / DSM 1030 / JCM 2381 / KCTC 1655 / WB1) TaxID=931626 RepID=ATPE_ACEWD|nr:ATP synthase F1 subunit epsilon [Acetobacterium woodii]P50009.2 RecName: Full=ATP synthase epsilon chain, sodium ion specific; AltName: Full=F-ATPase epsilon subunit, sodium ion specific; AltName: Full=Na(+)-translocating ATPase subunit epsilon [Acetobacterium woodii DSM 1030]AAA79909.1 F1FO ATPase epsilon subunit [Acetobacterium woodii DSM 1030]AFA47033.1 F-type ATP synthase subunit C [Acetobacterium woodii DSM 1030]prf//2113197C Na ATPase:SUBUNIT=epsilon [Acetobacterium woodii]
MAETFRLKIIAPTGVFFDDDIERVVIRGIEGELAILAEHTPLTTNVAIGTFNIIFADKKKKNGTLLGGIATINPRETIILTDAAEWPEEIDIKRAQEAKERALKRIHDDKFDTARARAALERAIARINSKENV